VGLCGAGALARLAGTGTMWDLFDFVAAMMELFGDFVFELIARLLRAPKA